MQADTVAALLLEVQKPLFAWALRRCSHREDAEDLAGAVTAAVLEGAERIRDEHAFYGYLWKTAGNQYAKLLRRRSRSEVPLSEVPGRDDALWEQLSRSSELQKLRRELSLLSRRYRDCTVSYYLEGRSVAETARQLQLSQDTVKYCLFQTRLMLREGMDMNREFGERSYRPERAEIRLLYWGSASPELRELLNRLIVQNLLLAAYHRPMSTRELAVELGIPTVYLEDELNLLQEHGLMRSTGRERWQSSILFYDAAFDEAFYADVNRDLAAEVGAAVREIIRLLPALRSLNFRGNTLPDEVLCWTFFALCCFEVLQKFQDRDEAFPLRQLSFRCRGLIWGRTRDGDAPAAPEQQDCSFALRVGQGPGSYGFIDFPVLHHHSAALGYDGSEHPRDTILRCRDRSETPPFPMFEEASGQLRDVLCVLEPVTEALSRIREELVRRAAAILAGVAPAALKGEIPTLLHHTLMQKCMSWLGSSAAEYGPLPVPDTRAALFGYL